MTIGAGEAIITYTDGVVDQFGTNNRKFKKQRLLKLWRRDEVQSLTPMVNELREHKGDTPQTDDIAALMLKP